MKTKYMTTKIAEIEKKTNTNDLITETNINANITETENKILKYQMQTGKVFTNHIKIIKKIDFSSIVDY